MACTEIVARLKRVVAEEWGVDAERVELREEAVWERVTGRSLSWKELVLLAFTKRVSLSEHAHYATPGIHFDASREKGHPFAYHVYGTAITVVTLDCLRGRYEVDAVKVVHDGGASMNLIIDRGQIEGGIVQGIGWMTVEEVLYDEEGRLRSNALSTYKVPDIYSVPRRIDIDFLHTQRDNLAIFRSKAVGEPPLMYGIGAYFALRNAVRAFNPAAELAFSTPMTPERALMGLYSGGGPAGMTSEGEGRTVKEGRE